MIFHLKNLMTRCKLYYVITFRIMLRDKDVSKSSSLQQIKVHRKHRISNFPRLVNTSLVFCEFGLGLAYDSRIRSRPRRQSREIERRRVRDRLPNPGGYIATGCYPRARRGSFLRSARHRITGSHLSPRPIYHKNGPHYPVDPRREIFQVENGRSRLRGW